MTCKFKTRRPCTWLRRSIGDVHEQYQFKRTNTVPLCVQSIPGELAVNLVTVELVQLVVVDIDVYRTFRQVFTELATTGSADNTLSLFSRRCKVCLRTFLQLQEILFSRFEWATSLEIAFGKTPRAVAAHHSWKRFLQPSYCRFW